MSSVSVQKWKIMMDYGVNPEQRVTNISDSDKIKNFFPYFIAGSVDRYFFFPCRVQLSIENEFSYAASKHSDEIALG